MVTTEVQVSQKLVMPAGRLAAMLADASVFASSDKSRPVLCAVKVAAHDGRVQVVGCDSYVLGVFTSDGEGSFCGLVDIADVKRILAILKPLAKTPAVEVVLERDGQTLTVRTILGDSVSCRLIEADYPNWGQLTGRAEIANDDGTGAEFSGFTTKTLGQIAKLKLGGSHAVSIVWETRGKLKPAHVYASHDGITFRGLVMPNRTVEDPREVMTAAWEIVDCD